MVGSLRHVQVRQFAPSSFFFFLAWVSFCSAVCLNSCLLARLVAWMAAAFADEVGDWVGWLVGCRFAGEVADRLLAGEWLTAALGDGVVDWWIGCRLVDQVMEWLIGGSNVDWLINPMVAPGR